ICYEKDILKFFLGSFILRNFRNLISCRRQMPTLWYFSAGCMLTKIFAYMKRQIIRNSWINSNWKKGPVHLLTFTVLIMFTGFFLFGINYPEPKPSKSDPPYMDISVKDLAGLDIQRALTGGIPIAEGAAPKGSQFVLLDHNDQPVPCQTEVLATWEEGSARWVLLDFQAKP